MLLWLSQGRARVLGDQAFRLAARHPWQISPAVLVELKILYEIERIKTGPDGVLAAARQIGDLSISKAAFADIAGEARDLSWTRDPLDRMVTANAIADGAKLLTADEKIRANFKDAVWD